jgi:hypothetical protein
MPRLPLAGAHDTLRKRSALTKFKSITDAIIQSLNMLDLGLLSLDWKYRLLRAELRRAGWGGEGGRNMGKGRVGGGGI